MTNHYFYSFLLLIFISATVSGQDNNKMKEDAPFQKTLKFESGIPIDAAISAFIKGYNLGKGNTFEAKKASIDNAGISHQRNQQFYKGIKVQFGMLITHSINGAVISVNGELYNASELNLIPTFSKNDALERALIDTHAQKYLWDDAEQSKIMNYKKPEGELVIFPIVKTGQTRLAYKFDIYATEPVSREEIFVDAHTGQILYKNPIIKHATRLISEKEIETSSKTIEMLVSGNADTKYSGARNIETTLEGFSNKHVLLDATRGNGIVTYNCEKQTVYQDVHFKDTDNNWTSAEFNNFNKDNGALDAHWGAEKTYDFWMNIFGRNSFDDNGAMIKSYVHYRSVANQNLVNAFWNGSVMTYGDGNTSTNILTSIDVCGHEIGHAICSYTADLAYQNQSGGMNEGFSDIWGACIEHYGRTGSLTGTPSAAVWKIGEDLSFNPLRSMSNPLSRGNPDTYLGTSWTTTGDEGACVPSSGNDNCGVHNNSGVLNHWFYILTAGKSGTNNAPIPDVYNVTGIGMVKSAEIAYLAERDYLTSNATYADARIATLTVAGNLYCSTSPEVISVTNAWYAVNVGEQYVSYSNDVALKNVTQNISVACGASINPVIKFENAGTNTISSVNISYNIDGGTNTNLVWNGNLTNCQIVDYPLTIGALTRGTHTLTVTTTITSDGNATNNTKTSFIIVNDAGTVNLVNTFDAATDILVSIDEAGTNNLWQRGISAKTQLSNTVAGNSPVYATNVTGLYPDQTKAFLVSQCYNLANITNPVLKFNMAFDLETDWDLIYMQYSTNGGTSWSNLGTGSSPTWYTSSRMPNGTDCFNCIGGQWTGEGALANSGGGTNAQMREYSHSLAAFGYGGATPQSDMLFRFVFHSDEAVAEEGAIIDNFVITGTSVLSTTENNFNSFAVYPNPSKGTVTLSLSTNSDVKVTLYDISGRNIYNKSFNNSDISFNQELKFNALSKGVYILNVESDGKKASKKLIIE
ncbi:M4 family metallopeptidase [Flavobacterium sp.]|uniref:M4 family metallopeptidase n=1 Tax=Flavobacterium sp. TaxID=239 RepID=UPI002B4B2BB9|nr:M4 family metallopeptidase [Flavobacterium sp.]HLF52689.1 M4 family metallopeptidase [Flavobacterium sp.]